MKKIIFLLFVTVTLSNSVNAQTDNAKIEKAIISYIENFFGNNFEAMNANLHPRLSKRGLNPDGTIYEDLPPAKLKVMLSQKPVFPKKDQNNSVEDITVFGKTATAKLITGFPRMRWIEWVTLVKVGDDWKIMNLFWEYFPKKKKN